MCEPSESIFTNLSLSSSQGPKLEISENYEAPTCLGTNTTIQVKIKNTGTSAASNSLIDFYLYSIFEKTKISQSNRVIIQVVMLGKFFDLVMEGESAGLIRYVATEGLDNKVPAILNVWF